MDTISIPFPQALYDKIILRSGGRLDPVQLAIDQVESFIDRTADDDIHWTREGIAAFALEKLASKFVDIGDPKGGHMWKPVFLPNGTHLRMHYKSKSYHAQVRRETIHNDDHEFESISQWVRWVASNTARNAWHDVWIKRPDDADYLYSDKVRNDLQG
jgi:hypothetical protein